MCFHLFILNSFRLNNSTVIVENHIKDALNGNEKTLYIIILHSDFYFDLSYGQHKYSYQVPTPITNRYFIIMAARSSVPFDFYASPDFNESLYTHIILGTKDNPY